MFQYIKIVWPLEFSQQSTMNSDCLHCNLYLQYPSKYLKVKTLSSILQYFDILSIGFVAQEDSNRLIVTTFGTLKVNTVLYRPIQSK